MYYSLSIRLIIILIYIFKMTSLETDAFELKRMMRQEAHEKAYEI